MTYLSIRNWSRYQHYKKRKPPWIKFYTELLDDDDMRELPVATRLLWDQLLLLSGRFANAIPNERERLMGWTAMSSREVTEGIEQLIKGRWIRETKTPRRASAAARPDASADAIARAEAEAEKALLLSQGRSAVRGVAALPDQDPLNNLGARMETNGRSPRGSVESILEVLPPTQIKRNTRAELAKHLDVLSVDQVEHIRNEVLASKHIGNLAGYAVSIAKSRAAAKGAA